MNSPFNKTQANLSLEALNAELTRLRNNVPSPIPYRNVFNDIGDEWANCSEEERKFIDNDSEYATANIKYQQQFNTFLLELIGPQFINSSYGNAAEEVLVALRKARSRFRNKTTEDLTTIQQENKTLREEIEMLKALIEN